MPDNNSLAIALTHFCNAAANLGELQCQRNDARSDNQSRLQAGAGITFDMDLGDADRLGELTQRVEASAREVTDRQRAVNGAAASLPMDERRKVVMDVLQVVELLGARYADTGTITPMSDQAQCRALLLKLRNTIREIDNGLIAGKRDGDTPVATPPAIPTEPDAAGTLAPPAVLAETFGTDPEATRQALNRWRQKNAGGDGYVENRDRRPSEPQYLYSLAAVRPTMEALKDRQDKRDIRRTKSSGQRPAR